METTTEDRADTSTNRVKRYPCNQPDCTRSYTSKPNLRGHLRTFHGIEGDFKCEIPGCDKGYKGGRFTSDSKQGLELHVSLYHEGKGAKKKGKKKKTTTPPPSEYKHEQSNNGSSRQRQPMFAIHVCPNCSCPIEVLRHALNFVP